MQQIEGKKGPCGQLYYLKIELDIRPCFNKQILKNQGFSTSPAGKNCFHIIYDDICEHEARRHCYRIFSTLLKSLHIQRKWKDNWQEIEDNLDMMSSFMKTYYRELVLFGLVLSWVFYEKAR